MEHLLRYTNVINQQNDSRLKIQVRLNFIFAEDFYTKRQEFANFQAYQTWQDTSFKNLLCLAVIACNHMAKS